MTPCLLNLTDTMNKIIVFICFYFPLFSSCLQLQGIVSKFISPNIAQLFAYGNLTLIIIGVVLFKDKVETLSKTNKLWFVFYFMYYSFAILATGINGVRSSIIATLVPLIYFIGFFFLLSNKEQFRLFFKVITVSFVISSFLTIILFKINFSLGGSGQFATFDLDRAGGVYGDANNAALANIIAFILFHKLYYPSKPIYRLIKMLILAIIFYSLFLTFSTTGLFVFTIILFLTNYKFFTGIRLILFGVVIVLFYMGVFALKSQTKDLNLSDAQIYKIDNIINVLTLNLDKVDSSGRDDLLINVLYYLYESPFIGNGVDFAVSMKGHNTYVGIWVDAGVFTFLFFVFMLCYYLAKTFTLNMQIRYFALSLLIALYIFMISLQTVINQPYLVVLFIFVGYIIDYRKSNDGQLDFLYRK
ncbi:hypothetical protein DFQ11_102276 [Winogradskyella epiphytica]|uniref:O-antigen ligase-like membrane protein n=2 Tax=Winogradskyella epiphytica TaxID=262005 RepID=A0A2V4WXG7_9FLAO|nr:hypothetical protein DFQ11_102276 [Winogradskyella epiphytica]